MFRYGATNTKTILAAFWHWPYHPDFLSSPTEYECRATNGVDPPVNKKIKYTPLNG